MAAPRIRSRAGVFSRRSAIRDLDGRTREGRIVAQVIDDLSLHVGGRPTATQALVIHATAVLTLRLRCALDRYSTGNDCESLDRHVVALQNGLVRNCIILGMEAARDAPMSLQQYLEAKQAAKPKPVTLALIDDTDAGAA